MEEELNAIGIHSIRLDVFSQNPHALKLYDSMGYARTGYADWRMGRFYLMEKYFWNSAGESCGRHGGEMKYFVYETAMGTITIGEKDDKIFRIGFGENPCGENKETALIREAFCQLQEYFAGKRQKFELPLEPEGTKFQREVWDVLRTIPYGEVRTYGQIAAQMGNPKAVRAVGMANHNNPIAIIIPCHRVIGSNGKLTGYAGGLDKKEWLLKLERESPSTCF